MLLIFYKVIRINKISILNSKIKVINSINYNNNYIIIMLIRYLNYNQITQISLNFKYKIIKISIFNFKIKVINKINYNNNYIMIMLIIYLNFNQITQIGLNFKYKITKIIN